MKNKFAIGDAVIVIESYVPNTDIGIGDILEVEDIIDNIVYLNGYCSMCEIVHKGSDSMAVPFKYLELLESVKNLTKNI
jgi:hypothetical protein